MVRTGNIQAGTSVVRNLLLGLEATRRPSQPSVNSLSMASTASGSSSPTSTDPKEKLQRLFVDSLAEYESAPVDDPQESPHIRASPEANSPLPLSSTATLRFADDVLVDDPVQKAQSTTLGRKDPLFGEAISTDQSVLLSRGSVDEGGDSGDLAGLGGIPRSSSQISGTLSEHAFAELLKGFFASAQTAILQPLSGTPPGSSAADQPPQVMAGSYINAACEVFNMVVNGGRIIYASKTPPDKHQRPKHILKTVYDDINNTQLVSTLNAALIQQRNDVDRNTSSNVPLIPHRRFDVRCTSGFAVPSLSHAASSESLLHHGSDDDGLVRHDVLLTTTFFNTFIHGCLITQQFQLIRNCLTIMMTLCGSTSTTHSTAESWLNSLGLLSLGQTSSHMYMYPPNYLSIASEAITVYNDAMASRSSQRDPNSQLASRSGSSTNSSDPTSHLPLVSILTHLVSTPPSFIDISCSVAPDVYTFTLLLDAVLRRSKSNDPVSSLPDISPAPVAPVSDTLKPSTYSAPQDASPFASISSTSSSPSSTSSSSSTTTTTTTPASPPSPPPSATTILIGVPPPDISTISDDDSSLPKQLLHSNPKGRVTPMPALYSSASLTYSLLQTTRQYEHHHFFHYLQDIKQLNGYHVGVGSSEPFSSNSTSDTPVHPLGDLIPLRYLSEAVLKASYVSPLSMDENASFPRSTRPQTHSFLPSPIWPESPDAPGLFRELERRLRFGTLLDLVVVFQRLVHVELLNRKKLKQLPMPAVDEHVGSLNYEEQQGSHVHHPDLSPAGHDTVDSLNPSYSATPPSISPQAIEVEFPITSALDDVLRHLVPLPSSYR